MSETAPVRYSWEPVERLVDNDRHAAELVGVTRRTIVRWKRNGIDRERADEVAVKLGAHPYVLWPEMRDHDIAAALRRCAAEGCGEAFLPYRPQHTYCSKRCKKRMELRRNPERRERHREANRRYYAECREYLRAKQREYERGRRARAASL